MVLKFLQQMIETGGHEANHQGVPFSRVKVHSDKAAQI